jgi:hypothetical protein
MNIENEKYRRKYCTFSLKLETYLLLKEFVRRRYGSCLGHLSETVEEAILYYISHPTKTYNELLIENIELRKELSKLKGEEYFSLPELPKKELVEVKREVVPPLQLRKEESKNVNVNLPSYLQNNPWVDILKERKMNM